MMELWKEVFLLVLVSIVAVNAYVDEDPLLEPTDQCLLEDCGCITPVLYGTITVYPDCENGGFYATLTCEDDDYVLSSDEYYCDEIVCPPNGVWENNGHFQHTCASINPHPGYLYIAAMTKITKKARRTNDRNILVSHQNNTTLSIKSDFGTFDLEEHVVGDACYLLDGIHKDFVMEATGLYNTAFLIEGCDYMTVWTNAYRTKGQVAQEMVYITPVNHLGCHYILMGIGVTDAYTVTSTENDTVVEICTVGGVCQTITLNRMESYSFVQSSTDTTGITGISVKCSTRCAVFCGFYFAHAPTRKPGSMDAGFVNAMSVDEYYHGCVAAPLMNYKAFIARIVASQDDTTVTYSNGETVDITVLNTGEAVEIEVRNEKTFTYKSDKPTSSVQIGGGSSWTHTHPGDACMVECIPPHLWLKAYTFCTPTLPAKNYVHMARITMEAGDEPDIYVSGPGLLGLVAAEAVPAYTISSTNIDGANFTSYYIPMVAGSKYWFDSNNNKRFMAIAYGSGNVKQYCVLMGRVHFPKDCCCEE